MSGLQEIAAILGIAETGFRAISRLYEFVMDLQHAPLEIENIRLETSMLQRTLSVLSSLAEEDVDVHRFARRIGLPCAVDRCGHACDRLYMDLTRWTQRGKHSWVARVQFRLHKKAIEGVMNDINVAKQTTILTVVVTQL